MAHMIKAHYELLQRQFQWKSEWCRKMNWVLNHLSLINSTLLLTLLGVPSCGSYDKLVEAAYPLPTTPHHLGQPDGWENFTHQFHLLAYSEINACQKVWSNWKCFDWNAKVCPELNRLETRAGTTWQIRFVSAPPPSSSILIFFSALFREVHNQRKRELELSFAASQRAASPPISLQCDVKGWASLRIHPTL